MPTVYINVNINTLFPIESLKDHLKEAFRTTDKNGYSVIIHNNCPAYAILKFPVADSENDKLLYDADDKNDRDSQNPAEYQYIIDNDIRKPLSEYLSKLQKENPSKLYKKGNWWDAED